MSTATYLVGDVFRVMAEMPDQSVDLILTSPPFLALRSYLPHGHPNKDLEIGSEPSPAEFLNTLLALTAEWARLLTPTGSIAVELGDTYSGSGGAGGDYQQGGTRAGQGKAEGSANRQRISPPKTAHRLNADGTTKHNSTRRRAEPKNQPMTLPQTGGQGWPLPKSMCMIPHLYAASLAYGVNILTGEPSPAGMWRVRNVVAWCRPNPTVGALGDKLRPATSFMVIATMSADRWFDGHAARVPASPNTNARTAASVPKRDNTTKTPPESGRSTLAIQHTSGNTRPPYDHVGLMEGEEDLFTEDAWLISPESYSGSHYATWPRKLLTQPITTMCPRQVCTTCGEPRRRIIEPTSEYAAKLGAMFSEAGRDRSERDRAGKSRTDGRGVTRVNAEFETTGWTDCGHNSWRPGHVLDPFGGSGTTGAVATGLGRDCTLIDLDERNLDLARERIGLFLTTQETAA